MQEGNEDEKIIVSFLSIPQIDAKRREKGYKSMVFNSRSPLLISGNIEITYKNWGVLRRNRIAIT